MIVWINGGFGAGKTSLADELLARLPHAMLFDPEHIGFIVTKWLPAATPAEFEDVPLWRRLVAEFALGLAAEYNRPLILPMTLVDPDYRVEIFGLIADADVRMLHVFLDVPADELHRRIDEQVIVVDDPAKDSEVRAFRSRNVERCVAARAGLPAGTLVLAADEHTPAELADLVLAVMDPRDTDPAGSEPGIVRGRPFAPPHCRWIGMSWVDTGVPR